MEPQYGKLSRNSLPLCPAEHQLFHPAQPPREELGTNSGEVNHPRYHRALGNKDRERLCWCFVCLCAATLMICVPRGSAWVNPGWSWWDPSSSGFSVPTASPGGVISSWKVLVGRVTPLAFPTPCAVLQLPLLPFLWIAVEITLWRANPQGLGEGKAAPNPGHPKALQGPSFLEMYPRGATVEEKWQYYFIPVDM